MPLFARLLPFCCALLLLAQPSMAMGPKVRITLANGEWPPLLGEKLPQHGAASQIVSRAFALRGIEVQYQFVPWKRALEQTRSGDFAGTLLWSLNEDRKNSFLISDPVYRSQTVLFYHSAKPIHWQQLTDLKGLRMGVTNGYSYGMQWEKLRQQGFFKTDVANTDLQNLSKLLSQRIDAFPCEAIVCQHLIAHHFPPITQQVLTFNPTVVHSEGLHLLLNKRLPNGQWLLTQFNQGLKQMKKSGELDQLLARKP
jgi:polar amino acid transport system substrate-binding protein